MWTESERRAAAELAAQIGRTAGQASSSSGAGMASGNGDGNSNYNGNSGSSSNVNINSNGGGNSNRNGDGNSNNNRNSNRNSRWDMRRPNLPAFILTRLPTEIASKIYAFAERDDDASTHQPADDLVPIEQHPAQKPPSSGACPLMTIPAELRHAIFARELCARDVTFSPCCGTEDRSGKRHATSERSPPTKRNRASDLMTINKATCAEVSTVLYEERHFIIHIHEGFKHGGIDFLDAGRQKLQYREDVLEDNRFVRFKHGEGFGFDRLKKIKIIILPAASDEPEYRHLHINTFFMTWALCQLLQRSEASNKLKYITVEFAAPPDGKGDLSGRRAIAKAENYLWDPLLKRPTATSIEWLPDIEVLLRPFSILRAHTVKIDLPKYLCGDATSVDFIARLQRRILSAHGNMGTYDHDFMDETYAYTIRGLSGDFLRYTFDALHGTGTKHTVEGLRSEDTCDGDDEEDAKHSLSPTTKSQAGDHKRWKGEGKKTRDGALDAYMLNEDEQMRRVNATSLKEVQSSKGKGRANNSTPSDYGYSTSSIHGTPSNAGTPPLVITPLDYGRTWHESPNGSSGWSSPFASPGRTLGGAPDGLSRSDSAVARYSPYKLSRSDSASARYSPYGLTRSDSGAGRLSPHGLTRSDSGAGRSSIVVPRMPYQATPSNYLPSDLSYGSPSSDIPARRTLRDSLRAQTRPTGADGSDGETGTATYTSRTTTMSFSFAPAPLSYQPAAIPRVDAPPSDVVPGTLARGEQEPSSYGGPTMAPGTTGLDEMDWETSEAELRRRAARRSEGHQPE